MPDLGFPFFPDRRRLGPAAVRFELLDKVADDQLVEVGQAAGIPVARLERHGEIGPGRPERPLQITGLVEVADQPRIVPGDFIHVEVEHDHVRIVVHPPEVVLPAATVRRAAFPVDLPVGDPVDAVGIFFLVRALELAPDEIPDMIFQRLDFPGVRIINVLLGEIGRLAEGRIVAGHPVVFQPVEVIRTPQDRVLHVPFGKQPVVPLGRVAVELTVRQEGRPLLVERFQRLGDEELEPQAPAVLPEADGQPVFAGPGETDFVHMDVRSPFSDVFDLGLGRVLGMEGRGAVLRPERNPGGQVRRQGHARSDLDICQSFVVKDIPDSFIAGRPLELEGIGGFGIRRERGSDRRARLGLAPVPPEQARGLAAGGGVDVDAAFVEKFQLRRAEVSLIRDDSGQGRHHQERPDSVRTHPEEE